MSFGHINWTKWSDRLLDAFLASDLSKQPKIHLIFAGTNPGGDYGNHLIETISNAQLGNRIQVTGYLAAEDYAKYLWITNLAVQLRTNSRGGTPKGVLDCLAHGVPVIVNNDASYKDYPDDVVIKLDPDPSVETIAKKLEHLIENRDLASSYITQGLEYVAQNHDPVTCAAAYAAALHEFDARDQTCKMENWVANFAPVLGGTADVSADAQFVTNWLCSRQLPTWQRRRLYVDVTAVIEQDAGTGIQRTVKETIRAL